MAARYYQDGTSGALPIERAFANISAGTTDGSIVAARAGYVIRVLRFRLHCGGTATDVTFRTKPGGAGTAISELFALGANGGRADPEDEDGHFETVAGQGLTLGTGAGSTVGVGVKFVAIPG